MKMTPKQKQKVHICIIGDSKCGKSSLIKCFLYETFTHSHLNTIINTIKVELSIDNMPFDLVLTEMGDYRNLNEQSARDYFKSMDIVFLCYKLEEGDDNFNEEAFKKHLNFISIARGGREFLAYIVGCQLDRKPKAILNQKAFVRDENRKLSDLGLRIETFSFNNKIKAGYMTSSLLNYNIQELFRDAITAFGYLQIEQLMLKNRGVDDILNHEKCLLV